MKRSLLIFPVLVCFIIDTGAQVINVPSDQSTIQAAINAASEGDTVLVAESTYYENINYNGKAITVASLFILDGDTSHISRTIINGSNSENPDTASVVTMWSGEDTTSVIMGFTITGGRGTLLEVSGYRDYHGAGIVIEGSGGKILNNIIQNNHLVVASNDPLVFGGGIGGNVYGGHTLVVRNNMIRKNSVKGNWVYGAGIYMTGGRIFIEGNSITENTLIGKGLDAGGGIFWGSYGLEGVIEEVIIRNNIIDSNKGSNRDTWSGGGGIYTGLTFQTAIQIYNNVISNNECGGLGGGIANFLSNMILFNNTIINNKSGLGGNTFHMGDGKVSFINNILWSDVENSVSDYHFNEEGTLAIEVYNNLLKEPFNTGRPVTSQYNIYYEPIFQAASYELAEWSPGIGQGVDYLEINESLFVAPAKDLLGNIRPHPIDGRVDIGAIESSYAGFVNIPDTAFLHALIKEGVDVNKDGLISYGEAEVITSIWATYKGISSVKGIEAFLNLDSLVLFYNDINDLDISNNVALELLDVNGNNLKELDISNNPALKSLICQNNQLTSLDISQNSELQILECHSNSFTSLDFSHNQELVSIWCSNNQITSLEVSSCISLTGLGCNNNLLSNLDLTKNISLLDLNCANNQITTLDLLNNSVLENINCSGNLLTNLDISKNISLGSCEYPFWCWQYESSVNLSNMPSLTEVCVWEEFELDSLNIDISRSPNVCFQTDCNGDCSLVGIEESCVKDLSIYPNPTNDLLTIETELPDQYSINIISLNGQLIFSTVMEGSTYQIDLTSFQKGVYLITIRSYNLVTTRKIIKL